MAETRSAWGIEIGQAGLKAIRLRYAEAAGQVIAVAYDYVPHPKLLSQPDAVPDELVRQSLETFLSRNKIGTDLIAMGLPGQSALTKFIQLPPVQSNKVAEIVKYEARQQIPFPLEEVIWDFQPLGGGIEESGFLLDSEVGLFAMKREQVEHHLKPFLDRKIEVEIVQTAPIALYNYLCYDRIGIRPGEEFEPGDEYNVLIDMGADTSTLIVTNGRKIWIRNVPVGGNHFTRALLKEMKLTFAKAEHLKCNATKSPDPRAVFQALRPVFNDYVSEIQKSIGYFSSVNRQAKIAKVIGVGNGFKLAGLQKFLQQNLQYEVDRVDHFEALVGDQVLTAPLFQDNLLTFPVPYGLALQALQRTAIHTSLLPPEIALARNIRRKKPWAVASAAVLLLGMATSAAGFANVLGSVSVERFGAAEAAAAALETKANGFKGAYSTAETKNQEFKNSGQQLVQSLATRESWLEIYKAIDECLPRDVGSQLDETELAKMNRMSLRSITCKKYDDLATWYEDPQFVNGASKQYMTKAEQEAGPTGSGYVFTLEGIHYHNDESDPVNGRGVGYVSATILKNLQQWVLTRQDALTGEVTRTDVGRMGITHATSISSIPSRQIDFYPGGRPVDRQRTPVGASPFAVNDFGTNPRAFSGSPVAGTGQNVGGLLDQNTPTKAIQLWRTEFTIQFVWRPILPTARGDNPAGAAATPAATDAGPGTAMIPPVTAVDAAIPSAFVPAAAAHAGIPTAHAAPLQPGTAPITPLAPATP